MGFFDLQVNGYAGVDFNSDALTIDSVHTAAAALVADGASGVLATIITERIELMCVRIARLAQAIESDELVRSVIKGIHVEGPFISGADGFVGAHPRDAVLSASTSNAAKLIDAGQGKVRLVTLAPEADPRGETTAWLVARGVTVSAGHTNASLEQLRVAIDSGMTMFTHLGNACPPNLPRHDNIIQRVLSLRDQLYITFIADGVHVPFFALRNYLDLIGTERAIVITDAIAPAGLGPGRYSLGRWDLLVGPDLVARSPDGSHLVGSAVSMKESIRRLRDQVGLSPAQIGQLTEINPRRALRLAGEEA